jgi:FERM/RhoGEF/pleckstrin domain protein 2
LPPPPPPIYDEEVHTPEEHHHREATLMSKSSASAASATLTSNASITSSTEEDGRRKVCIYLCCHDLVLCKRYYMVFLGFQKHTVDKAYYIAKELLMTERTYRKDLEVILVVSPSKRLN